MTKEELETVPFGLGEENPFGKYFTGKSYLNILHQEGVLVANVTFEKGTRNHWHIQMGFVVIPGSKNVDHIRDNYAIYDFNLDDEDMRLIATLNNGQRRYIRTDEALERYATLKIEYEKE